MTTNPTTPKRWRPKFSLRTLVILATVVCCYAACWGPTKTRGVDDVVAQFWRHPPSIDIAKASAPLVVSVDAVIVIDRSRYYTERHYYFWFFGYVAKLPFERQIAP